MRKTKPRQPLAALARCAIGATALLLGLGAQAASFTVDVVDGTGSAVSGFRWVLQEDTTYPVDPASPLPIDEQLSLNFHKSHHPLALDNNGLPLSGNTEGSTLNVANVPAGRYYLSVLPYSEHALSGTPVDLRNGDQAVTVTVQGHPIPTAQIAVYLFHDCYPLNGAPDLPEEQQGSSPCNPAVVDFSAFNVVVEEPAGKYGIPGGPLLQDAFGNPLGTEYTPAGCDYNAGACNVILGDGTLAPNPDGTLLIKNLAPGKYGIIVTPPAGWTQTSTIEGSPVIDAWVKAKEPQFFVEFGPPGPHVFMGFTRQRNTLSGNGGVATVSGTITDMHMSRPPSTEFFSGRPFPQCWVAVNEGGAVPGINRYAMPCDANSGFNIPGVPPGDYELKVFDRPLDVVIATLPFTVNADGSCNTEDGNCAFGDVPVFNWFNRLTTYLFNDTNQNGFWDADETPLGAESGPVNIRFRDGTVYQSFPTDFEGAAPFDEVFPWFHWVVAEVGFTNKKATGATVVVDAGGPVDTNTDAFPGFGELNPQAQSENNGLPYRTETGPVLTQAFQGFLGQTSVIQFGKADYLNLDFSTLPPKYIGENGGISGIVFNTVTRAENDPQFAVGEEWEPGVPRVQVNLYADGDIDSPVLGTPVFPNGTGDVDWNGDGDYQADNDIIDDVDRNGCVGLADVDNYPLGNFPGPEDLNRDWQDNDPSVDTNLCTEVAADDVTFDLHDAIQVTWTDSWDDSTPTNCQGQNNLVEIGIAQNRCFDGMRNWNQARPGVFDGGYAFSDYDLTHLNAVGGNTVNGPAGKIQAFYDYVDDSVSDAVAATLQLGLLPADYIVEATTPPGYKALREHHKNVDFGDDYIPSPEATPPACVGPEQTVPELFAIATKDGTGEPSRILPGLTENEAAAPFAGDLRPVCDQKKVPLQGAQNAAADFFLVSDVPVAANLSGMILNDLGNEFNPNSPNFGEKYAPPYVPVAFYDWAGKQVNRIYADQYGRYNAMVPSTWSANLPQPSGMSPNMLVSCMNDAGPIPNPDPDGPAFIIDPSFNPQFSQFCYTFQYMPGSTTYLDTPVEAIAAFTTPDTFPVDCEQPNRTPKVAWVQRHSNSRPAGTQGATGPFVVANNLGQPQQIQIRSMGQVQVPNPNYDGDGNPPKNITRDYRFGAFVAGSRVDLEDANGNRTQLTVAGWNQNQIIANVPLGHPPGDYQVVVTRAAGVPEPVESPIGVTLTVGVCGSQSAGRRCTGTENGVRPNAETPYTADELYAVHDVQPAAYPATPIQDAIDAAAPGDLILVRPGVYDELVIMWKPVKLQGWGAGAVTLNARQVPTEKVAAWRAKAESLVDNGLVDLLPGQEVLPGFAALQPVVLPTEEGAGILVLGRNHDIDFQGSFRGAGNRGSRVDGFTIVGASQGGAIVANGYTGFLNVGNNRLIANSGFYGGGIRIGHATLTTEDANGLSYTDAWNDSIRIHHNHVAQNGNTFGGAGGGISLYTGADGYAVQKNWVCGNFSASDGGGIAHLGLSDGGLIEDNAIIFNESFSQANAAHGGGVFIAGQTALQPTGNLLLSSGAGTVTIDANLIRGNLAGAGDGGGIRLQQVNGLDVFANPNSSGPWYDVYLFNNMVNNNVAGAAGGGVSLQDTVSAYFRYNTIANNDSTATAAAAFDPGVPNISVPQPAGIVSRAHTVDMAAQMANTPNVAGNDQDDFSNPELRSNIVYENRSFYWDNTGTTSVLQPAGCTPTNQNACVFSDLAVLGVAGALNPVQSLLTQPYPGGANNLVGQDPLFVRPYFNGPRDTLIFPEATTLQTAGAFDEGGNFIQVTYGPLTLVNYGQNGQDLTKLFDYHLRPGSPAINTGSPNNAGGALGTLGSQDFDNDPRGTTNTDIGADEVVQ